MIKVLLFPILMFLVIVAAMFAGNASAAKFDVPQGGGKLPTIALVECLAEEHSRSMGEYCYMTYSCSPTRDGDEVRGTLWRGMLHHDGRRVTTAEDSIAFERSCVVTVADDAKITWFTAYRPDGKGGEIVGIEKVGGAAHTETRGSFTVPHDNMLAQFLSHEAVRANTLDDWIEDACQSDDDVSGCRLGNDAAGYYLAGVPATPQTDCYVGNMMLVNIRDRHHRYDWLLNISIQWYQKPWDEYCPDAED